jgi:hypothetical protein
MQIASGQPSHLLLLDAAARVATTQGSRENGVHDHGAARANAAMCMAQASKQVCVLFSLETHAQSPTSCCHSKSMEGPKRVSRVF